MIRQVPHQRWVSGTALLVLLLSLLLTTGDPALGRHEGAACGFPFQEEAFADKEFVDIGNRFLVRNIQVAPHPQGVVVAGELLNDRQGFFTFAFFKVQLFNADCTYLGANNFAIDNFDLGTIRPFRVIVPRVKGTDVATYHIEFLR